MICSICRNPLIYSENDCILRINKKTSELIVTHCYCMFHQTILNHEFRDYYKENVKKLTPVVKED